MYRMKGLGNIKVRLAILVAVAAMLSGCCHYGYRCGNPCEWPSGSIEMGIVPMPMFGKGCNPCGYDPCYPFGAKSGVSKGSTAKNDNWGYDNSDYLSSAGEAGAGSSYY